MEIELEMIDEKLDDIGQKMEAIMAMMMSYERLSTRLATIEKLLGKFVTASAEKDVGENMLFSLKEAAGFLHLSVSRVYALIYQKKLTPIQTSKNTRILFAREELDNYLSKSNIKD